MDHLARQKYANIKLYNKACAAMIVRGSLEVHEIDEPSFFASNEMIEWRKEEARKVSEINRIQDHSHSLITRGQN